MKVDLRRFDDYDGDDPDIEFRKKRYEYWAALRKLKAIYVDELHKGEIEVDINMEAFAKYVEEKYGLRMHLAGGAITDKFDIVNEGLYAFFILKYM